MELSPLAPRGNVGGHGQFDPWALASETVVPPTGRLPMCGVISLALRVGVGSEVNRPIRRPEHTRVHRATSLVYWLSCPATRVCLF